ncbi:hypothetical protein F66182_3056 [Fusarium sp. NRRL 66182]|nr:hypothetical protein F66182_3056 [Fusarium sp. NRRL 66182]
MHIKNAIVLLFAASAISMPVKSVRDFETGALVSGERGISPRDAPESKNELLSFKEKRGTNILRNFHFDETKKLTYVGVQLAWNFLSSGALEYVRIVNPTKKPVVVQILDAVTNQVLETWSLGVQGFAKHRYPQLPDSVTLQVQN